ncbi:hypothetical protein IX329_002484 [Fusobacterium necrophorum]|nr:hypothetical protein [Fusobacterium necrophorum]MBR8734869.1 hypothetical protein [Fusobacterium necrophorum]MBR8791036.1 hypothetical protein [Fusobacterium necrophorum]
MKKILLIAPEFYSYEEEIIWALIQKGNSVEYISLYPKNLIYFFLIKILSKLFQNLELKIYECMFKYQFKRLKKNSFDYILVINGETLNSAVISYLKKNYLNSFGNIILYIWTPVNRYPILLSTYQYYSKVFSFEERDCLKYNFEFLPNFYSNIASNYKNIQDIKYDIFFVGQYRKERYLLVETLKKSQNVKCLLYHNRLFYHIFKFYKRNEYKDIQKSKLIFRPIKREEMYYNMALSKCLLDDTDINQQGLTQRVFDSLILQKKLITTNANVASYDFYNPNNILIIDRNIVNIPVDFFERDYKKVEIKIIEKYSIKNWVDTLLGEER